MESRERSAVTRLDVVQAHSEISIYIYISVSWSTDRPLSDGRTEGQRLQRDGDLPVRVAPRRLPAARCSSVRKARGKGCVAVSLSQRVPARKIELLVTTARTRKHLVKSHYRPWTFSSAFSFKLTSSRLKTGKPLRVTLFLFLFVCILSVCYIFFFLSLFLFESRFRI